MSFSYHYLIIGNGAAGLSAAEIVRRRDPTGRITIVTNEPYLFYPRPGIAYYILGQVSERQLISRSISCYRVVAVSTAAPASRSVPAAL
jgi:NADPH-dependent 2,4-dienoyl-CoA reductase/sulfur reductase-like enzyme